MVAQLSLAQTRIESECVALQKQYDPVSVDIRIDDEPREIAILRSWDLKHQVLGTVLQAMLKFVLGYTNVTLKQIPRSYNTHEQLLKLNNYLQNHTVKAAKLLLKIWISVPVNMQNIGHLTSELSRRRAVLRLAGEPGTLSTPNLYSSLFIDIEADKLETCQRLSWYNYHTEFLHYCNFIGLPYTTQSVVVLSRNAEWSETLKLQGLKFGLNLRIENFIMDHEDFKKAILEKLPQNKSFLILDDDPRYEEPYFFPVQDYSYNIFLIEFKVISFSFEHFAPTVDGTVRRFYLNDSHVRSILRDKQSLGNLTEAACRWLRENPQKVANFREPPYLLYSVRVFVCSDDPDIKFYPSVLNTSREIIKRYKFKLNIDVRTFTCPSPRWMCGDNWKSVIKETFLTMPQWYRLVAVVGPSCGAESAQSYAENQNLPLFVYEASPQKTGVLDVVGGEDRLWAVARDLLRSMGWSRVALLTDRDRRLRRMMAPVDHETTSILLDDFDNITAVIEKLLTYDARVMVINTDSVTANRLVCAGADRGMSSETGYTWLLLIPRWLGASFCNTHHLVLTYSFTNQDLTKSKNVNENLGHRQVSDTKRAVWPSVSDYLSDALLAAAYGYNRLLKNQPESCDFSLNKDSYRQFKTILSSENITIKDEGNFYFNNNRRASSSVFLLFYDGVTVDLTAEWEVDKKNIHTTYNNLKSAFPFGRPSDGTTKCIVVSGHTFRPQCHDILAITLLILTAAMVGIIAVVLNLRRRRMAAIRASRIAEPLAALASLMFKRKELALGRRLGAGTYGRVYEATWRHTPRIVAVKTSALESADAESELIREAALMATLRHANVLRLFGVVADGGPVALVLELMFFGDLASYLRERRSLAFDGVDGEAEHLSAEALTSLALQAARALSYLAVERVLHRDVRAANCLLDSRRRLRLADFGLARRVSAPESTYRSTRRALFPVAWMAPESLLEGAWSSASDVWSFGVLLAELVGVGARPYGSWSLSRVVSHARAGGRPRLPRGAGVAVRALTAQCWRVRPADRPAAHELVQYLADHPRAVCACPDPPDGSRDVASDSGYNDTDCLASMHSP